MLLICKKFYRKNKIVFGSNANLSIKKQSKVTGLQGSVLDNREKDNPSNIRNNLEIEFFAWVSLIFFRFSLKASMIISATNRCFAYNFFKSLFSYSSSFIRCKRDASIRSYLILHL